MWTGLLQGEILSPILFSLFLNDAEMCLQEESNVGVTIDQLSIYLLLFADDAVIMSVTPLWAVSLYYVRMNICHQHDRHMYQPGFEPATS